MGLIDVVVCSVGWNSDLSVTKNSNFNKGMPVNLPVSPDNKISTSKTPLQNSGALPAKSDDAEAELQTPEDSKRKRARSDGEEGAAVETEQPKKKKKKSKKEE